MDLGFIQAGHEIVWANDCYSDAVATYRQNLGDHIVEADIETLSPAVGADIVIGGFPCQGFSIANRKRHVEDRRNRLYLEFLRIVRELKPLYFVAENVKGILSLGSGRVIQMILGDFRDIGYDVGHCLLNAADYGVPQRRERVFIVGALSGEAAPRHFPPRPTHANPMVAPVAGLKPWVSVGAALESLPEPGTGSGIPNHARFSRYKLRFNGHLGHRRIDPSLPAPTITARGDERGGVVVIHHPSNERRVTPREAALIQGFPLGFEFIGGNTSAYRQIANAVPPPLARAVAGCLPVSREQAKDMLRVSASSEAPAVADARASIQDWLPGLASS